MSTSTLRKMALSIGIVSALIGSTIGTAAAEDDHWRHEQRDERDYRHHDRWEHERDERRYTPPPVVVTQPPRVIYEPPPVVIDPFSSGINIVLPIIIR